MLHVAVAVVRDRRGLVLLSRRREGTHLGGLWEFPGGKVEGGESLSDALKRELSEETGISIQRHRPLIGIRHHYPEKSVFLDVHLVTDWSGEAHGREGQEITWCDLADMHGYDLPAADKPILTALRLPSCYAISPPAFDDEKQFLHEFEATLDSGIQLIQLRLPDHICTDTLAGNALRLCERYDADLMIKDVEQARRLGCGLHLRASDMAKLASRPISEERLLAASCHDADEAGRAERLGVDFITLSPVLRTASHPDASPLGWQAFSTVVDQVNLPVYALGGVDERSCERAWEQGAQGVAGIGGLWRQITSHR